MGYLLVVCKVKTAALHAVHRTLLHQQRGENVTTTVFSGVWAMVCVSDVQRPLVTEHEKWLQQYVDAQCVGVNCWLCVHELYACLNDV